ncbi:hypothetical protein KJ641_02975 [Patescibacteria group bacterium]|nr:hypothetical protein [Patescibacteria group bacterium]
MKKKNIIIIIVAILIFIAGIFIFTKKDKEPTLTLDPLETEQACPGVWDGENNTTAESQNADISFFYTIPRWFERKMDFVDIKQSKFGNEIEVYAKIMPWLQDMENIDVKFNLPEGLTLVSGKTEWSGNIKKCEVREFALKVKWTSQPEETQRLRMFFEYDFPKQELLDYVEVNKDIQYDNPQLRKDLIDFINEKPDRWDDDLKLLIK